jgi:hypothetical protein
MVESYIKDHKQTKDTSNQTLLVSWEHIHASKDVTKASSAPEKVAVID